MARAQRKVAVVTGTRAEFGLLVPVIRAIRADKRLELQLVAAGSHFLAPARTIREVEAMFPVAARVRMQGPRHRTRRDDALATARGIEGFTRAYARLGPDWVLVLGDRIEAFAAASAAAIAGIGVAHIHGGDRAEGIADESMRHAITKLAHLHLAATEQSAERIAKMGERPEHIHVVGSPAIDGLRAVRPLSRARLTELGDPEAVFLMHPSGASEAHELEIARHVLGELIWSGVRTLALSPNHDAGRHGIVRAISDAARDPYRLVTSCEHLPRTEFLSLLCHLSRTPRTFLIGNSSAGLIEAAALRLNVVNIGPRQDGRERAVNVVDVPVPASGLGLWAAGPLEDQIGRARMRGRPPGAHPYGDGRTGPRIARLLAVTDPGAPGLLRKRNSY